jgi:hypothetical protein
VVYIIQMNYTMIYLPDYNISAEDIVQGFEINDREYRRGNKKWTVQKCWQHWGHKAQDVKKYKTKKMSNTDRAKTVCEPKVLVKGKQFLHLIRHKPC